MTHLQQCARRGHHLVDHAANERKTAELKAVLARRGASERLPERSA
jgi:hypothetical protein